MPGGGFVLHAIGFAHESNASHCTPGCAICCWQLGGLVVLRQYRPSMHCWLVWQGLLRPFWACTAWQVPAQHIDCGSQPDGYWHCPPPMHSSGSKHVPPTATLPV